MQKGSELIGKDVRKVTYYTNIGENQTLKPTEALSHCVLIKGSTYQESKVN